MPTWLRVAVPAGVVLVVVAMWFAMRPNYPEIDGERAFQHIEAQMLFGPRIPGSEGHQACRDYLVAQLRMTADQVAIHEFDYVDKKDTSKVYNGQNIVASFNVEATHKRVMLGAHWDTRAIADQDPFPENRTKPVPGANDGGSGVAVLLEVARVLSERPLDFGVDIILFDLEDIGDDDFINSPETLNAFAVGSHHFVLEHPTYRPTFGMIVDIVGDKNLRLPKEGSSYQSARSLVDRVWATAAKIGADAFVDEVGQVVYDDHAAFLTLGIPVINIVQWPFPEYWHTIEDTPDKCSPESLKQVGDVLLAVLYGE